MTLYVNNEKIEEKEIQDEVERLRPHYNQIINCDSAEEQVGQLYAWSRENVIERVLLRQAALKNATEIPVAEVDKAYEELLEQHGGREKFYENFGGDESEETNVKKDVENRMKFDRLIESITKAAGEPTDAEIKSYYESHQQEYMNPEMIRAAHIVKHVTPETDPEELKAHLEQILKEIKENGTNFAEAAAKNSDCPENGGDLGYFPRGHMVQEFEDVVFNMEVDEISGVFQTEFGFHIAKVTDRREATPATLDEVRETIVDHLSQEKQQKAIEDFVDAEKENAAIEER